MRGAYYASTALLVAVSSQTAALSNQPNFKHSSYHDVDAPGAMVSTTLPQRFLRGTRDLQTDLMRMVDDEERMRPYAFLSPEWIQLENDKSNFLEVVNNVAQMFATKLDTKTPTEVMLTAAQYLLRKYDPTHPGSSANIAHSFKSQLSSKQIASTPHGLLDAPHGPSEIRPAPHAPSGSSVTIAAARDSQLTTKRKHYDNLLDSQSAEPVSKKRTTPETDEKIPDLDDLPLMIKLQATEEDKQVHNAFKALDLPFKPTLKETLKLRGTSRNYTPGSKQLVERFKNLAKSMTMVELERVLGPELENLSANNWMALEEEEKLKKLREAYILKMIVLFELFFDFHNQLIAITPKKSGKKIVDTLRTLRDERLNKQ